MCEGGGHELVAGGVERGPCGGDGLAGVVVADVAFRPERRGASGLPPGAEPQGEPVVAERFDDAGVAAHRIPVETLLTHGQMCGNNVDMTETTKTVAPQNTDARPTGRQMEMIERLGRRVVEFPFTRAKVVKWHFGPDMEWHMLRRGTASELIDALKTEIDGQ